MAEEGNGTMTVFRWGIGLAQALIVILITVLLNGQGNISEEIASLRSDVSVVSTRVTAVEPIAGAYGGLTNRVTALETIANENSRRMTDNSRKLEMNEAAFERKMERLEKQIRDLERKEGLQVK